MKRFIRFIAVLLCAATVICYSLPSFASTGNINCYITRYYVKAHCVGVLSTSSASVNIALAFIPNVPHFPEEDYSCQATVGLIVGMFCIGVADTGVCGMNGGSDSIDFSGNIDHSYFDYYINYTDVYSTDLGSNN